MNSPPFTTRSLGQQVRNNKQSQFSSCTLMHPQPGETYQHKMLRTHLVIKFRTNHRSQPKFTAIMRIMMNISFARRPYHLGRTFKPINVDTTIITRNRQHIRLIHVITTGRIFTNVMIKCINRHINIARVMSFQHSIHHSIRNFRNGV